MMKTVVCPRLLRYAQITKRGGGGMKEKRSLSLISFPALAYFLVALVIYSWVRGFIDTGTIAIPKSLENIFWLLFVTGLSITFIAEVILLIKHRKSFRSVSPMEIEKSDLIKTLINFLLTLFFSYVLYLFVISRQPNLGDPLAFLAVSSMVYIATAAFCQKIRYIPLFIIFFRRKHERV